MLINKSNIIIKDFGRNRMVDIINSLYALALTLTGGVIIAIAVTGFYIIGIIKYTKKEMKITEELEKIEINKMSNEKNI